MINNVFYVRGGTFGGNERGTPYTFTVPESVSRGELRAFNNNIMI
jgi:hypothetical protein